ncbi:glycerol-3-phosphate dehydrogenase, partial [Trifolium medium]|nr:glycerol-3-phosphate dehydrogenase [Trifolium medium]
GVSIPFDPGQDRMVWKHTVNGDLQQKEAYAFKMQQFNVLDWTNFIWSKDIPPSKSMMVWRLMHDKIPTDDNLMVRGCCIPSMCSLCNNQLNSLGDMWKLCESNWSPQSKVTITAAVVNLLNIIWWVRNQARFNDKLCPWRSALAMIVSNAALSGNNTSKRASNSMKDFSFLKLFDISIHQPKSTLLKEIIWKPPLLNWFKCNVDGTSNSLGAAACGGVFRDHADDFVFAFAQPLGFETPFFAERFGAILAIELAYSKGWLNLWLETDSLLVVSAFNNATKPVAWPLSNRWKNAMLMVSQMNCVVTHIYREGNDVADLIARHGLTLGNFVDWIVPPLFILDCIDHNKLGLPRFRVCNS